jgi:hypothetical protein
MVLKGEILKVSNQVCPSQFVAYLIDELVQKKGTYGTLEKPSDNSIPGGRVYSCEWIDNDGLLWLFGGLGLNDDGETGEESRLLCFFSS